MFCSICGTQLQSDAVFCHSCGNRVDNANSNIGTNSNTNAMIQYTCGGCGSNLLINSRDEIVVCGRCGTQLRNPLLASQSVETRENKGLIWIHYDSVDSSNPEATVTVLEKCESVTIQSGNSVSISLEPGSYNITVMMAKKKYEYNIVIYSNRTELLLSLTRTKVRNLVELKYKHGINCDLGAILENKNAQIMYSELIAAGFTNVSLVPLNVKKLFHKGEVASVFIDGINNEEYYNVVSNNSIETKFVINFYS